MLDCLVIVAGPAGLPKSAPTCYWHRCRVAVKGCWLCSKG
jgi:hypothetical protein